MTIASSTTSCARSPDPRHGDVRAAADRTGHLTAPPSEPSVVPVRHRDRRPRLRRPAHGARLPRRRPRGPRDRRQRPPGSPTSEAGYVDLLDVRPRPARGALAGRGRQLRARRDAAPPAAGRGAVIVCVPTPVDDHLVPDLAILRAPARPVVEHAVPGQTLILTSTTYVGSTAGPARPRRWRERGPRWPATTSPSPSAPSASTRATTGTPRRPCPASSAASPRAAPSRRRDALGGVRAPPCTACPRPRRPR